MYERDISGVVLAAGYSSRMGIMKPLLHLADGTVVETTIQSLLNAGVMDIYVVIGYQAEEVRRVISQCPVSVVFNPMYCTGMFSSIQAAVRHLPPTCQGFLLLPVDIPLVKPTTISKLIAAFAPDLKVVYPIYQSQRGHPPVISTSCIKDILASEPEGGMRTLLKKYEAAAIDVAVDDPAINLDMDTPQDYCELMQYSRVGAR